MDSQEEEDNFEYEENNQQIEEFEAKLNKQCEDDEEDDAHDQFARRDVLPSIQPQNKIEVIQKQLEFYNKKAKPLTMQEECEEIINSKNETLKDKKIRELVQRNKALQVKYEKEKVARQKLEESLKKAMQDAEENIKILDKSIPKNPAPKPDPLVKALKPAEKEENGKDDLKTKFKEADKKVQEQRVKIQQLKSDLNKAFRVIQREVGVEQVNLDQLILDENSWKARAQQIEILKGKVKDLTSKLGQQSQYSESSMQQTKSAAEKSQKSNVQMELLRQQVEALRSENDQLQQKFKAASSRKQILEDQMRDAKAEYEKNKKILLEKSDNDDKYIQALKAELERAKRAAPAQETKIIYKPTDDEEARKLKQELKYCKDQLARNEQIIKELVAEKVQRSSQAPTSQAQPTQAIGQSDERIKRLEEEVKLLKKERDDFFKTLSKDPDTQKMLKDLTMQNVKLRTKIDDLSKK